MPLGVEELAGSVSTDSRPPSPSKYTVEPTSFLCWKPLRRKPISDPQLVEMCSRSDLRTCLNTTTIEMCSRSDLRTCLNTTTGRDVLQVRSQYLSIHNNYRDVLHTGSILSGLSFQINVSLGYVLL